MNIATWLREESADVDARKIQQGYAVRMSHTSLQILNRVSNFAFIK
jgi:hypothetical protein